MSQCSDAEFAIVFQNSGAPAAAKRANITERGAYKRRDRLEKELGVKIEAPTENKRKRTPVTHNPRIELEVDSGRVIVFSDAHYWPGLVTTAHKALLKFCKTLKPVAVIANGDMMDGASISRHSPLMWEEVPSVADEIACVQDRLGEVLSVSKGARHIWTFGNHDARFEARLATVAPEFAHVHGVHLKDHFPEWEPCWSVWINGHTVVKHRFKSGTNAGHTNVQGAGMHMVTGHDHFLGVAPFTNYKDTLFGVRTGTLSDPSGPQFAYTEDNPRNHRSGFVVLSFDGGRLLWPEMVHVLGDNEVEFRGEVHRV